MVGLNLKMHGVVSKVHSIFPLDRSQISSKKTSIGAVFQAVENNNIENLFDSSTVSIPLVLGNATNAPNTLSRMSNREFLLKSFATLNNAVQQVGKDINKSVLNMLRDQLTPTLNKRVQKGERIKRSANYNMTSADAIAYDEAKQASKKQKLDEQAAKKLTRGQKKITTATQKAGNAQKKRKKKLKKCQSAKTPGKKGRNTKNQSEDPHLPQASNSILVSDDRLCYSCESNWANSLDNQWLACEQCSNWSCIACVFGPTMEFICNECE